MKELKDKISITIDQSILKKIREQAEYEDRSVSSCINLILREYYERLEKGTKRRAPK